MTADAGDLWRSDTRGLTVRTADSRTAGRMVDLAIGQWNDHPPVSHVVFARRGREAQRAAALRRLSPAELSALVAHLPPERRADVLETVDRSHAVGALSVARPRMGGRLVQELEPDTARKILTAMPIDDAVAAPRHVQAGPGSALLQRIPTARAADPPRLEGLTTVFVSTAKADSPGRCRRAPRMPRPRWSRWPGKSRRPCSLRGRRRRAAGRLDPAALDGLRRVDAAGVEAALDDRFSEAPLLHGTCGVVVLVGAGIALIPGARLVEILFLTQALNAVLLLPLLWFMRDVAADRRIMGAHALTPRGRAVVMGPPCSSRCWPCCSSPEA